MTEVAQLKLFTRREPERLNLHSDYINDVLYSPAIEDPLKTDKRVYDKVNNSLGIRRDEELRRSTDVVGGHSEDVANIWDEEEERDKEELEKKRVVGNGDGGTHSRRHEAPASSSAGGAAAELGSDLDMFVESEFQFLDSDDEAEGSRSTKEEVSHLGTLTKQHQTEVLDPSPSNLSAHGPSEFAEEEATSSGLDEPVVTSHRTSLPQDDVYDVLIPDLESPPIPAPPPLPPAGILLAVNARSATEQLGVVDGPKTSHQSETINGPEAIHGAANARPKDNRPKNEPQSPQNVLFLELQGKLNRRLRKINEDMERNNETESSISAAAAAAVVPIKLTQEPLHHQTPSHLPHPEQTSTDRDHQLDTLLLVAPNRTDEIGITEKIDSAIAHGSETTHIKDSSMMSLKGENMNHLLRESVEPPEIESSTGLLLADGGVKDLEEDSISRGRELIGRGTMVDLTSQTIHAPDQVEELESQGVAEVQTKHTEVEERLHEVNSRKTVRTLIGDEGPAYPEQLLQPESEGGALHLVTSSSDFIPAPVADVVAITKPQSASVRTSSEFIGSLNHPEMTSSVVRRPEKSTNRPRPSSSTAIHVWETPSGDEWTPQMDLMDDEFEDDFPQGIISRRHHQKRLQDNTAAAAAAHQRRPQKRTPSKLYQKKQLGGPQRPAPNPGAFSLARINRAVKKVFGSISSKPSSKQRTPISESVFLQEDGWEIYPSRPYDQSNPGEPIKVVGVEKRPAYAYNAFTRQLVILPDHDRVLVTEDGRRIRDQDQQRSSSNGKTSRPTSPGRNREKPRFTSKSKASSPRPPNLNTKTVKSIHMQGRRESVVEDDSQTADDAYWRRNSSPNFAGAGAPAASPTNLSKRKTSTLSKILSFRKSANTSAGNGKKGADQRLTSSDVELMKQGVYKVRHDDPRQG